MRDINTSGNAVWTHRLLAAIARGVGNGTRADVAQLAQMLGQAPWWNGCPDADAVMGTNGNHYRRLSLREPLTADDYSVLLIAWPAGHATPIHDHDGLWGIELVLDGVLQVESFSMTVTPALQLTSRNVTPLGIGDHTTFSDSDYAHRCRNLSAQRPALSLHVYGGALQRCSVYDQDPRGSWESAPQSVELELAGN